MQAVRSYKIRGAYNKMATLPKKDLANGVVCASAGNHTPVAYFRLPANAGVRQSIYAQRDAPAKVKKLSSSERRVEVVLFGDTFDDAYHEAKKDADENKKYSSTPSTTSASSKGRARSPGNPGGLRPLAGLRLRRRRRRRY
ncbi:MAG: pyridoxal-phosphate dependent enzyme [Lewinellaceae bacterium]|nr:pyridoxal-phosphate dependent enzyme [Lewinellaceae bacterium]